MRTLVDRQGVLDFPPSNLTLTNRYYAKYTAIAAILDANPAIAKRVHADLQRPAKYAANAGHPGRPHCYTSDTVLRVLLAQVIEGESLRGIVIRIDDSHFLRRFTRIHDGPMLDYTTLDKLKTSIQPATWAAVNALLAKFAVAEELIGGDQVRLDTTAVETNVHYPTDSHLLWDVYRVVGRVLTAVRELAPEWIGPKRLQLRRTKRLHTKISRMAGRKRKAPEQLETAYADLIGRVEGILAWAAEVGQNGRRALRRPGKAHWNAARLAALLSKLEDYDGLGKRVVDQARRRVLDAETVPTAEKLFSIHEPHTELLVRGKARQPIEFGHMVQLQQTESKFITAYDVFDRKPHEPGLLEPALRRHKQLFGSDPEVLTADRGYYADGAVTARLEARVPVVSIAKKGTRTAEETEREHDPVFRHAQRFRAGVEGTISFCKRVLRMARCLSRGWPQFVATVGLTVFAHNLLVLTRA